jgi:peptidoglycan/LPS O-acetylase OafA/YrhL
MKTTTSLYIDALRFISALLVILYHSGFTEIANGFPGVLGHFGNEAVMVFFVLSGFVIAYASRAHDNLSGYMIARLSRLWSVVIPALVLTAVVGCLGSQLNPQYYHARVIDNSLAAFSSAALFLNQVWDAQYAPGLDYPFWSVCYEFWYYVVFAAAIYLKGTLRLAAVLSAAAVAGPKILLLLPTWLLGVAAYHVASCAKIRPAAGWVLWMGSGALLMAYIGTGVRGWVATLTPNVMLPGGKLSLPLIVDIYIIAVIVAANLVGFDVVGSAFLPLLQRCRRGIRYAASHTFSMYLFHYPLLSFFAAVTWVERGTWWSLAVIYGGTLVAILAFAPLTEWRKASVAGILQRGVSTVRLMRRNGLPTADPTR